jgi:presenilin-like A22 family membrane protease
MKHTLKVAIALVLFFFLAQFTGLLIINQYIDHTRTVETKTVTYKPLPYNIERPEVKNQSISFIYITLAILIGTLLVLLLIKFNKPLIWKFWFFVTVWLTLAIAFAAFINNLIAAILALIFSILKLYKPNIIIQNLSEIFIYGGLAAIFVPMINLLAAFMLLIVISVYDYISVFKTRHMIKLAKFQSKTKVFAGLLIPYDKKRISYGPTPKSEVSEKKAKVAVLGGGDIGFTLIFAGVVMKGLMLKEAMLIGFLKTLIVPVFVSFALLILLLKGQQNKFYPAMPVLSLGCLLGYLVILLV